MTNPYHTQKIDSEPPRMKAVMQKSYSPDARFMMGFMMGFMMTNHTHMKASPNNSTSKAQKSKNLASSNARSATELIFGLQRAYRML